MTGGWALAVRAVAVLFVTGVLAAEPERAHGQETGTLTIYGAVCPVDYQGDRFVEDCSATPAAGASYQVRNTETNALLPSGGGFATANDEGIVVFADLGNLAPGTIQILAMAPDEMVVPGGYTAPAVTCTAGGRRGVDVALIESAFTGRIVELGAQGEDLRCDVYFVPLSLVSNGEATTPAETTGTDAAATPAPGRAPAVYAGDCADGEANPGGRVVALTELTAPAGAVVGQTAAAVAATSYSVVPLSLDQLLAEPRAIAVESRGEDASGLIACGEIGGVLNDAGALVIGLREVGGSDYSGIAFLAPSPVDPGQTEVSVFLAAGLAG